MATKKVLEDNLTKVSGVSIWISFARTNMVAIAWYSKNDSAFEKLQSYFNGILFDYDYNEDCDTSVCYLNI